MSPPAGDLSAPPRTLVLCFDGTSNRFQIDRNTNVVLLFQMLQRDAPDKQLVYYQTGIGTYMPSSIWGKITSAIAEALDEAFAWYLGEHVIDGYKFLMQSYRAGDRICLFGFSRGAYTARALAGMLYRVGLLPPNNTELVGFAYTIFKNSGPEDGYLRKNPDDPRGYLSRNFRDTYSRKVTVEYVGLFDTVSSVGFIPRTLPNTKTNPIVKHVRHALALDERRVKFKSNTWSNVQAARGGIYGDVQGKDQFGIAGGERTIQECWFVGSHGDVGGGKVGYKERAALGHIPLRWIIHESINVNSGIAWDEQSDPWKRLGLPAAINETEQKAYDARERADALSPWHNPLKEQPLWWLLEIIPLFTLWHYMPVLGLPNWGRPRKIKDPGPGDPPLFVHASVRTRQEDYVDPKKKKRYVPAAWWGANWPFVWVDPGTRPEGFQGGNFHDLPAHDGVD